MNDNVGCEFEKMCTSELGNQYFIHDVPLAAVLTYHRERLR